MCSTYVSKPGAVVKAKQKSETCALNMNIFLLSKANMPRVTKTMSINCK